MDYVPDLSPVAQRLARRCWPGPVTLVLDDRHPESLVRQLPASVREAISPNEAVGLRVPAHVWMLEILRLTAGPVALTSANRSGCPEAVTAEEVVRSLGDDVDLVLDDGRVKFGQPSSVVRVLPSGLKLLRSGVIDSKALRRLSSLIVLFVCTGNTCRSPMAEGLMRRRLAQHLGCSCDALEDYGVMALSAGIAAMAGGRATPEAIQVMAERGIDLQTHESQPLSERLVRFADLILTMTSGHREAVLAQWPEASCRTHVLGGETEVADPIGGPLDAYRQCADQIDAELEAWLQRLDFSAFPTSILDGD
jgi:protein-tyrosine phosphatase